MAQHSKEWNEGYQAAIEAIKKVMNGSSPSDSSGSGNSELSMPKDVIDKAQQEKSGSGDSQQNKSRNNSSDDSQGIVRPEDCIGPSSLDGVPGTPGGMIDRQTGDQIVNDEGYEKEGGSEDGEAKSWADAALKASSKLAGDKAGSLKSKLEGLYKVASDWKKELRKVVGHSISPEDKRQAYANKNILISQDRIARTDKDKYDNLDYMMAWIDSSGSMSDEQLKQCLSEVYAVALAKKPIKLIVIQCDTKIQDVKEYHDLRQLKQDIIHATVKGRGGTELKPCWDLLVNDPKYKRRPCELVMIFTDGYLNQYKRNPRTMKNLCWVILDNPSWEVQYKDINTKVVHIATASIK